MSPFVPFSDLPACLLLRCYWGTIAKGQPLLFTAVRNQVICIDDLERRGAISVKDVFGLISYVREQRTCKVVLLLNETQLKQDAEAAKEFENYFEKGSAALRARCTAFLRPCC
jgi:hypothetical protein